MTLNTPIVNGQEILYDFSCRNPDIKPGFYYHICLSNQVTQKNTSLHVKKVSTKDMGQFIIPLHKAHSSYRTVERCPEHMTYCSLPQQPRTRSHLNLYTNQHFTFIRRARVCVCMFLCYACS